MPDRNLEGVQMVSAEAFKTLIQASTRTLLDTNHRPQKPPQSKQANDNEYCVGTSKVLQMTLSFQRMRLNLVLL